MPQRLSRPFLVALILAVPLSGALAQDNPPTPAPRSVPTPPTASPAGVPAGQTPVGAPPTLKPGEPTPASAPVNPSSAPETVPPPLAPAGGGVNINYVEADLYSLLEYFARATGKNFVIADQRDLQGKKVTIISNKPVSPGAAYEAFLSALEVHGLTVVQVGNLYKIIKAQEAQQSPGRPGQGGDIQATDQYITQIIQFDNISVSDVREIVDNLVSPNAKVLAYAPANTLILTDTGYNIRRIYDIISKLDIAAPRATMAIYPIVFAKAEDIKQLIEDLYGTAEDASSTAGRATARAGARNPRAAARANPTAGATPGAGEGVTAGKESNYITKVLSDERTNSLIVLANEQGQQAVKDLIAKLDIDVDPTSRSQIYVYRLEHAKAEDIAKVLQTLSQTTSKSSASSGRGAGNQTTVDTRLAATRAREAVPPANAAAEGNNSEAGGAIAAFDSGMRIAADENTNSLVIIASRDDYAIIESVIKELDTKRKQVYLDAVILELSSNDALDFNLAYHTPFDINTPFNGGSKATGIVGGQFGTNSLGLDPTGLSGLAFGIFGQSVAVPVIDPSTGSVTSIDIPAFGIALQALKTNQMVNIVSNPSVMALDNEEAKIVVGRKIPFPTSNGLNSLGQPVVTYQREDVAITLDMTPRINSENFVTLELDVEVQEVEDSSSLNTAQAGFITSNREIKTVALVGDNETVVLGGLVGSTDSKSESKIPILGDLPLIGALFRNHSNSARRTNLMVFITPHIIDDSDDLAEIMRVKEAQREEFMRRFYGKSQDQQMAEIKRLLQYSMNNVDKPSVFRGPATIANTVTVGGQPVSAGARDELEASLEAARQVQPGEGAGLLPNNQVNIVTPPPPPAPAPAPETPPADGGQ